MGSRLVPVCQLRHVEATSHHRSKLAKQVTLSMKRFLSILLAVFVFLLAVVVGTVISAVFLGGVEF
jgi:cell division septal protein FtsQ